MAADIAYHGELVVIRVAGMTLVFSAKEYLEAQKAGKGWERQERLERDQGKRWREQQTQAADRLRWIERE